MVWIHGGGLFTGSMRSDVSEYYSVKGGIRNLVSRGVVLVNIQYRIGLLGKNIQKFVTL
jgi:carboxylesterase type B